MGAPIIRSTTPVDMSLPTALESYCDGTAASLQLAEPGYNRTRGVACLIEVDSDVAAILIWLDEFTRSPTTHRSYRKEIERFYNWLVLFQAKNLSSVTWQDIDLYDRFMQAPPQHWCQRRGKKRIGAPSLPFEGPLNPRSRVFALAVIGAFFSYLVGVLYLAGNPFVTRRRNSKSVATDKSKITQERYLSLPVARQLLNALEHQAVRPIVNKHSMRVNAERQLFVVRFLMTTGLRGEELAGAHMSDIYWETDPRTQSCYCSMRIISNGNVVRDVAINESARQALLRYRSAIGASNDFLGNHAPILLTLSTRLKKPTINSRNYPTKDPDCVSAQVVYEIVRKALRAAAALLQFEDPNAAACIKQATPHWFRNTFASMLGQLGASTRDIQIQLGHECIATTAIYSENDRFEQSRAISTLSL